MRSAWLTLTIGLMFLLLVLAPDLLLEVLTSAIVSTARYTRQLTEPVVDDLGAFVLEASLINVAQVFVVLASLILLIGANAVLLRRLLTWYAFPQAEHRLLKAAYGTIAVTTASFGLAVLSPVTIALLRPEELIKLPTIIMGSIGFTVAIIGLGLFLYADRAYAGRCPDCGARTPGPYWLGKRCDACDGLLHRWMIAEYDS